MITVNQQLVVSSTQMKRKLKGVVTSFSKIGGNAPATCKVRLESGLMVCFLLGSNDVEAMQGYGHANHLTAVPVYGSK